MKKYSKRIFSVFLILIVYSNLFSQDLVQPGNFNTSKAPFIVQKNFFRDETNSQQSVITVLPHDGYHSRHSAPQSLYRYARCYYLITAAEMNSSGYPSGINITSIGFDYKYGTNLGTTGNFKVYFENTSDITNNKSLNWNLAVSTMNIVHSAPLTIQTSDGPFDIPLNSSNVFAYTGGGIYVAFEYSNPSGPLATISNVVWANRTLPSPILKSSQSDDSLRVIATGTSNLRPDTRFGCTLNDIVSVGPVYSMGVTGVSPCRDSNFVRAIINHKRAISDLIIVQTKVKMVFGSLIKYVFTDTLTSNSIESIEVKHKYLIDPSLQFDSIIVTALSAGDDIIGNNKSSYVNFTTINSWNHFIPSLYPDGGVGLSVGTGDFVAKFYTSCSLPVVGVDLSFFADYGFGNCPYKVIVYKADGAGGLPGTLLHSSSEKISPGGVTGLIKRVTYFLPSPVIIDSGYYYVGYSQTAQLNLRVSYQSENPIRTGEFYYTNSTGSGNWTEFAEISPYRFDVAPRTYLTLKMKAYLQGFCSGPKMISDSVKVFIRSQFSPYSISDSAKGILDTAGTGLFNFVNVNLDSCYYFDVRHRNHLRTYSNSSCNKLNSAPAIYDFTSLQSKAFGSNMIFVPNVNSTGGFAFFAGDVNKDNEVDVNDLILIFNAMNNFTSGYVKEDVTGDNFVDSADLIVTYNNVINLVSGIFP